MGKKKREKMRECAAGAYIPHERAAEMVDAIQKMDPPEPFLGGAVMALGFLTTPESSPRHGMSLQEYLADWARDKAAEMDARAKGVEVTLFEVEIKEVRR